MTPWNTGALHYFTTPSFGTSSSSLKENSSFNSKSGASKHSSSSSKAKIIAIVVAAVAAAILILAAICIIRCCYRRRTRRLAQRRAPAMSGGFMSRGWQKVDGDEKLGDEDFSNMPYDARDRLVSNNVPVYNERGMAYEPYRPHGKAEAEAEAEAETKVKEAH
ncbi:uncharacterized protein PV09_07050 [Verruconis gallopava]|uniref:Uncharacterized protein n=1 Tax=Verruconis gallopava TaxID=253628 RepID=A0A0D1XH85_9PEZI|nr:uncharacterized protein PV09_07050 [Verruconis gallopava]KIW01576.1 hypothetical protein PV09_07050 [Verruconis gallopava]